MEGQVFPHTSHFNLSCLDFSSEGCGSSFSVYSTILKNIFSPKHITYSQTHYEDKCTYHEIFAYLEESTTNSNMALLKAFPEYYSSLNLKPKSENIFNQFGCKMDVKRSKIL